MSTAAADTHDIILTADQARALDESVGALCQGDWHLLMGPAGTGKTTLLPSIIDELHNHYPDLICATPTHKAAAVARRTLARNGIEADVVTLQALLGLRPDMNAPGEAEVYRRSAYARPVEADAVIVDECSMVGADLFAHCQQHLHCPVLHVGDGAQLPPVGEAESPAFAIDSRSELTTIVRQAADNPIIAASAMIRGSLSGAPDWSWCRQTTNDRRGIYTPGPAIDLWLQRAFTSDVFADDVDTFRYLAWRNARVAEINVKVRHWRYGEDAALAPFVAGETAITNRPVVIDDEIVLGNNVEAEVLAIRSATINWSFRRATSRLDKTTFASWSANFPTWKVRLCTEDGEFSFDLLRDEQGYMAASARAVAEAKAGGEGRWRELRENRARLLWAEPVYALTVHKSQGSTFGTVFVDLHDIRLNRNLREMQQLLYTAVTRASERVVLRGSAR